MPRKFRTLKALLNSRIRSGPSFASILLSTDDGRSPSVIVLTSPSAQEGRTTTATNLAVALASIGKKVLLIDADLRKPRLHQIFGLRNHHGFSDVLADETQLIYEDGSF